MVRRSDSHVLTNIQPDRSLRVKLPNSQVISSVARGTLTLSGQTESCSQEAYVFSDKDLHITLLSLSSFAKKGCIITLHNTGSMITLNGEVISEGIKAPNDSLWLLDLAHTTHTSNHHRPTVPSQANLVIRHENNADRINFAHATFGSPPPTSMLRALKRSWLSNYPGIDAHMFAANTPNSVATAKGHLDQKRQGQHSTKRPVPPRLRFISTSDNNAGIEEDDSDNCIDDSVDDLLYTQAFDVKDIMFSDLTGKFPHVSRRGNQYILLSVYRNYIHFELMRSRHKSAYIAAYTETYKFFANYNLTPSFIRIDNETSKELETFISAKGTTIQKVPPGTHRANRAERAIRAGKNHIIATLCTAHPSCPLDLWDESTPQAEITLNHLRPSLLDPTKSAYEGICGTKFNFAAHPIAPFGTPVVIHDKPSERGSWDAHGVKGYYLGPALQHYRCWRTWATASQRHRISDTLQWFPEPLRMPGSSPYEVLTAAVEDLTAALATFAAKTGPPAHQRQPYDSAVTSATSALRDVVNMLSPSATTNTATEQRVAAPAPINAPTPPRGPPTTPHSYVRDTTTDDTPGPCRHPDYIGTNLVRAIDLHRGTERRSTIQFRVTWQHHPNKAWRSFYQVKHLAALLAYISDTPNLHHLLPHLPTATPTPPTPVGEHPTAASATQQRVPSQRRHGTRKSHRTKKMPKRRNPRRHYFSARQGLCAYARSCVNALTSSPNLNLTPDGRPLTYRLAKQGLEVGHWEDAEADELSRLMDTNTINPIFQHQQPMDRRKDTTYYNPQVKEKMDQGVKTHRVRGTIGGDRINYPGDVAARTADMEVVKALLQSTLADDADFMTIDIKDFYLNTPLERKEYLRIGLRYIPRAIIDKYNLDQYLHHGSILFEVCKGMYGLPQAGLLAQVRLIRHLSTHGYIQDEFVPCLFTHISNGTAFTLVVDDFGVKYTNRQGAEHLIDTLKALYPIKVDWTGTKYLGMTIDFQRGTSVSLSIPNHVPKALARFRPHSNSFAKSPGTYVPPVYGTRTQYVEAQPPDDTLPAQETKFIQEVVGSFLYYARAVDPSMLPAITSISSEQAHPTQDLLDKTHRFLAYAEMYPANKLTYKKSDMILIIQSDASYLSRSKSRSVAGAIGYLGSLNDPSVVNGALFAFSTIIDVVVASAAEAEYGAAFMAARHGEHTRTILTALGHPQPPTPLLCDNKCAVGLAHDTIKIRRSKSIDMRFHWIRDRQRQGHFNVTWQEGSNNLADFFTKPLPVHRHQELLPNLVTVPLPATTRRSVAPAPGTRTLWPQTPQPAHSKGSHPTSSWKHRPPLSRYRGSSQHSRIF